MSEWAKSAVRESASTTAPSALKLGVIDLIAKDVPDLLRQLDGRQRSDKVLRTAKAEVVEIPMTAGERFFQMLWRPEVMFVLMLVAIYGIIGEMSNPGAILPGVAGAVALVLALYMGSILPINMAGLALILLAVALFIIDVFAADARRAHRPAASCPFFSARSCFSIANPAFRLPLGLDYSGNGL